MEGGIELVIVGWSEPADFDAGLEQFIILYGLPDGLVLGGVSGPADKCGAWATERGVPFMTHLWECDWKIHYRSTNQDILSWASHVLVFPCEKSDAIDDMIAQAIQSGKTVIEIKV